MRSTRELSASRRSELARQPAWLFRELRAFLARTSAKRPRSSRALTTLFVAACVLSASAVATRAQAQPVSADDAEFDRVPSTFSYTQPAEANRVRALLEMTGVYTFGFTFYLATNKLLPEYDVNYSWPVYRKKLLGQGFEFDLNGLNTNFVGHPTGGSMYYIMARSNQLSIAESEAFAIGGSLLWELFGEVREYMSINDSIVTPLAGMAIAEPVTQLGAFFDRSSPTLTNRILGTFFAPIKTLNDLLDGRTLARSRFLDERGFPANEFHQFDLRAGSAAVVQQATDGQATSRSFEARLSAASKLVRLPGYDDAGRREYWFTDGNVSSMQVDAALAAGGLVDLEVHTVVAVAGYHFRNATGDSNAGLHGQGTLVGLALGYQYVLHDYDRDRPWPRDRFSSVQPLGVLLEQRAAFGALRFNSHLEAGLDFGGARPYALTQYVRLPNVPELPKLIEDNRYYFMRGGHLFANMALSHELFEIAGKLRYDHYTEIDVPIPIDDTRILLEGRVTLALGHSPGRIGVVLQHRSRSGHMGEAKAAREELSLGLELGARY